MAGDKKTVVKPFRMTEKEAEKLRLDAEGKPVIRRADAPAFSVQGAWEAETENGGVLKFIDYASAGKTWAEDSRMECWMPTED